MGRRGPKPLPKSVLQRRGSRRAKTREELPAPPGRPEPPDWLGARARAEWDFIIPHLERLGILSKVDATALAVYCDSVALYIEARDSMDKSGGIINQEGGTNAAEPALHRAFARVRAGLSEFGLTPAARASMRNANKPEDKSDPNEDRFFGP